MQILGIMKILGLLIALFSITLLPPIAVSLWYMDQAHDAFILSLLIILTTGAMCWFPARHYRGELRFRDGFLIVVLIWVVLSIMAAIPLLLVHRPELRIVDALFESTSGLTTTGATILTAIDDLPLSVLYYRQQLQWLGGMGIIVLAVAVMPALGVGGMQLYRAETPGPMKDHKLTPRITETAKAIWRIYLGLTVLCGASYYFAGMSVFDAISHAFSTVAIGGFSTHEASLGYFQSNAINLVATVFMLLAGLNFALHFSAFRFRRVAVYINDPEAKAYFGLLLLTIMLTVMTLHHHQVYEQLSDNIVQGMVQVVSIVTTTGFTTTNFSIWPTFIPILLILLSTAGGCAGSTAGGMKIIRMLLLFKQGAREISKLVHPSALIPIKLGGKPVPDNVVNAVWGFLSLYIFSYAILLIMLLATGADLTTAFSAVTACLNNLGPGLGDVSRNYASISDTGKIILTFAMVLGRLELFTLLVLFTPVFWKG
ncbi:TrkH family potassium uptake protein [Candidatus Spongiihabitans sp.]|uniref:TrkH family potassium uptake protein n=1 Tax=Candidatus Spongiihabitans sp. TaxID=3101308 RepID=UPI003C7C8D12